MAWTLARRRAPFMPNLATSRIFSACTTPCRYGAAERAAARVGLSDRMEQAAGALSRGLRQRLAIAQTIVHAPKVLLLDEPAAGLDPQARRDLSRLLVELRDGGMTLVVSSHILAELEDYSDRMVIVDKGHIAGGESIALKAGDRLRLKLAALIAGGYAVCEFMPDTQGLEDVYFAKVGGKAPAGGKT